MRYEVHQILIMGVSGSGKTSVGTQLAQDLDCHFLDADDFHTPLAKAMMAAGTPLTEKERAPWLSTLCEQLRQYGADKKSVVMAVSGLKRTHRKQLKGACENGTALLLDIPKTVLHARIKQRIDHFFPTTLLDSQLSTLEMPSPEEGVTIINGHHPISTVVALCKEQING